MNWKIFYFCFLTFCIILLSTGCANFKTVPYFQNSAEFDGSKGPGHYDLKIKSKDKLSIFVFSGNDEEAVSIFNIREPRELDKRNNQISVVGTAKAHIYLVDNEGNIDFPVLGSTHVEGLTIDSINSKIKHLIIPYLQSGSVSR